MSKVLLEMSGTGGNNTTIFRAYVDGGGSDIWQPHPSLMRAAPTITTEGTWETEASTSQPIVKISNNTWIFIQIYKKRWFWRRLCLRK
jgi:hypothetical protein